MVKRLFTKNSYVIFFVLLLAFILITVNSKFSFLYAFHEVDDVHCFITVARCMLRGDVLYKDVYEHKGPIHYFLYCLGIGATPGSFLGLYVIEILLFAVFLWFVYRTITLFVKREMVRLVITASVGVWATVMDSFCGGGECEELTLPFIAAALYCALKPYGGKRKDTDKDGEEEYNKGYLVSAIIGFCFAIVFWTKYTITGAFAGYVVAVLVIGLIRKNFKYVLRRAIGFAAGASLGSLPVILYFSVHDALGDLWEVYFFNLIFKYSQNDLGGSDFWGNVKLLLSVPVIIAGVGTALAPKTVIRMPGKIISVCMLVSEIIGLAAGKVWGYVFEARAAFYILFFVGLIGIFARVCEVRAVGEWFSRVGIALRTRLLLELDSKRRIKEFCQLFFVKKRELTVYLFGVALLLYSAYFAFTVTPYSDAIGASPDDYAIIRVSKKVQELVPDHPVIICFTSLDPGLYYLTDTFPPEKYFCKYNLFSPQELGFYEKYIENGKADFVISYKPVSDLEAYGYSLCYGEEKVFAVSIVFSWDRRNFYLYARNDLLKSE